MPLTTLSRAAHHAITTDRRIFGTAAGGFVWCAPGDCIAASWTLGVYHCDVLGPWAGHIAADRIVLDLEPGETIPIVVWHVSERDREVLDAAGLIDAARCPGAREW